MSQNIRDGEFWLPPEFLTEDDLLMKRGGKTNRQSSSSVNGGFGLYSGGGCKSSFPYEFPNGFGSFGFSSEVNSPVESVVGSTEESEEEDNLTALLSMKMAHSALEEELAGNNNYNNNRAFRYENPKEWVFSRSPQSTLGALERGCGCRHRGHPNSQSKFSSPSTAWDLLYAAAGEVDRMKTSEDYHYETGFLGPPRKHTLFTGPPVKNSAIDGDFYSRQSLSHLRLQAAQLQQLKQQQMLKQQAAMWSLRDEQFQNTQYPVHHRGGTTPEFVGNRGNCRPLGLSPSAFPPLQQSGSGKRAVILGNPPTHAPKPCAGTGVFLPRRISNPVETRKKPGSSTVLVPVKVMQALNLNLDNISVDTQMQPRFNNESTSDAVLRLNNGNAAHYNRRSNIIRPQQQAMNHEIQLPQEWTY